MFDTHLSFFLPHHFPPQVVAHYDLMAEFGVKVPEMQQAAYHTMDQDYMALRDAQVGCFSVAGRQSGPCRRGPRSAGVV